MTVSLFGAILCSSLYLLEKFTSVDIFEVEKTFKKSPNGISRIATILPFTKELSFDANKDGVIMRSIDQKADRLSINMPNMTNRDAILLLTGVVDGASRIQQQKSSDEQ